MLKNMAIDDDNENIHNLIRYIGELVVKNHHNSYKQNVEDCTSKLKEE